MGDVTAVRVWAYGTPPERQRRDLFVGNDVVYRESLETVDDGALHVRLRDGTDLRLGSASRVVLDEFIYDPDAGAGTLLATVAKGVCRFITGEAERGRFVVGTPVATIVPRGTEFSVWVEADGSTRVWVQSGTVEVTPLQGNPALVRAREIVRVRTPSSAVERNAPRPAADPGLQSTTRVFFGRGKKK
ncbi:MAG: FecR domain-containing protein [Rhodospirillaceae bacterium]|nr:FecR domain-containing protein [Rhodospirillaceae bacterium]